MKAILLLLAASLAVGQTLTTVTETVVGPDGQPVSGQASIHLTGACQSGSDYVGQKTVTAMFTSGAFSVSLVPNSGGCVNTSYAVQWNIAGGTNWTETWVVPVSSSPVSVNSVLVNPSVVPTWARGAVAINITTPLTSDTGLFQYADPYPYNVSSVSCSTDVGSVSINIDVRSTTAPNMPGVNILSGPLVCGSATTASAVLSAPAAVPAGAPINLQVLAVSGSPDVVRIFVQKSAQ
jgi:hypothetical protein